MTKPADPDFAARIRASFARQSAMVTMGAAIESVEPGRVVVALPHTPQVLQQHGFIHGGVVAAALDTACGYAASSLMAASAGVLTVEFKVNFVAPARGPLLRCEGVVVKAGRTLSLVEGRAWQMVPGGEARLVATMVATLMTVTGRDDVRQ